MFHEQHRSELLKEATKYAKENLSVVRLHYVQDDGGCSCASPNRLDSKHAIGKHPVEKEWEKSPKLSPADVFSIWGESKEPWNIGLRTGETFWVLDLDPERLDDESETLQERLEVEGFWPTTCTGSGGFHWFFLIEGLDFIPGNSRGRLPKAFDVRGKGGQVVAPPSVSAKGPYIALNQEGQQSAPSWLVDLVRPLNVAPVITDSDRAVYEGLSAERKLRVDRYTRAAIAGVKAKLSGLKDMPPGATPGWDESVFKFACDLLEFAHSPWCSFSESDAYAVLFAEAPRDSGFGDERVNAKFTSALKQTREKQRPAPKFLSEPEPKSTDEKINPDEVPLEDSRLVDFIARDLKSKWKWNQFLGWLKWDGKRWKSGTSEAEAKNAVRTWMLKLLKNTQAPHRLPQVAKKLSAGSIGGLTGLLRGVPGIHVAMEDFDRDYDLLNVQNGIVDLRTGELSKHDPSLMFTQITSVAYDIEAKSEDFDLALEALPEDSRLWFQLRIGQSATGWTPPDDLMVICQGGGENGKGSIMEPTTRALGDYYCQLATRAILGDDRMHPTELMDLRGARLAVLEETPEAHQLNVQRLKSIVGTPIIKARKMKMDSDQFDATHALFINTNFTPIVNEADHGTWRRLALLKFPYTYRKPHEVIRDEFDKPGIPGLRDRLRTSTQAQEAALLWVVRGAVRWYGESKIMPEPPTAVQIDTLAWRSETDVILNFWNDCLKPDFMSHISSSDLTREFGVWLQGQGQKPWSQKLIGTRFQGHALVRQHGVSHVVRRLSDDGLSRPNGLFGGGDGGVGLARPLGNQFRAWSGLKWTI